MNKSICQFALKIAIYLVIITLYSCSNTKNTPIEISCFGKAIFLLNGFQNTVDSLNKSNITLEYNDSFSGEQFGVKMYSYQEMVDSFVVLKNLYFESEQLKGVSIDITSKTIQDSTSFLKNIQERINECVSSQSELYNVDTSINDVNHLESSSGKIFHLKIYDRLLHKKIPFVF